MFDEAVIPPVKRGGWDADLGQVRLTDRCDCSTSRMISSFSAAGYLILGLPQPRSCFFEQTVFKAEIGHKFLQCQSLGA